jgi:hypothetical protein
MPRAVFAASHHGSLAHRTPLHQTNRGTRALRGALLMSYHEAGCAPQARWMRSQTARSGRPSRHRVPGRLVHAYTIGPWVPSDTVRRDQHVSCRVVAMASPVGGAPSFGATGRAVRAAPVSRSCVAGSTGPWRPQRVADGSATRDVSPRQASTASRTAGRWPERQSAPMDLQGQRRSWARAGPRAPATGGLVCKTSSGGT